MKRRWSKQDLNNCLYEPRATYVFQDCIRLRSILASASATLTRPYIHAYTYTTHRRTHTTYVRRKAWFPAKTSSFNLLAHGSVLVWTRFFRASESNEQYVCVLHTYLWYLSMLQLVNVGPAWIVVVASQKFVSMKSCLDGNRYRFSYELYYIAKYIHKNMSSRELVISKSTRKLDKRDSRRIETV